MLRLWNDIKDHRRSTVLFMVYWLSLWVLDFSLGWNSGIPTAGMVLLFSAPVFASVMVAWWRDSAQYRGGALVAGLVTMGSVMLAFIPDTLAAFNGSQGSVMEWASDAVVSMVGASLIFGVFGGLLGLIGAFIGITLRRVSHPNNDDEYTQFRTK